MAHIHNIRMTTRTLKYIHDTQTYIQTYIHACKHTYIHAYMHTYMAHVHNIWPLAHVNKYIQTTFCTHTQIHTFMWICKRERERGREGEKEREREWECVCVCVCMCVCVCVIMHVCLGGGGGVHLEYRRWRGGAWYHCMYINTYKSHTYIQMTFCKRATNYRALLRKMTCKDKASYGSSSPWSTMGWLRLVGSLKV